MSTFSRVRGMRDFLPEDADKLRFVEKVARNVARLYGYREIVTPIVEPYDLLAAKSGRDIRERMYTFKDLGGRKLSLRPEFTASIARLMTSTLRNEPKPVKLFCVGSLYRYDEPQFGRYREFWQTNYELVGSAKPEADVEILLLTHDLMRQLQIRDFKLKVGHIGVTRGVLTAEGVKEEGQNAVMQLLDKKKRGDAVSLLKKLGVSAGGIETLTELFTIRGKYSSKTLHKLKTCVKTYEKAVASVENLETILDLAGELNCETVVEGGFARGLEYYTGMILEIFVPEVGIAIGGGGRYDKLVELFGGESTPAVGVAHGVDRITLALDKQEVTRKLGEERKVAIIPIKEDMRLPALKLASSLRNAGVAVEFEIMGRNVKRALEDADRRGATHTLLLGPEEFKHGKVVLRDMVKREQRVVEIPKAMRELC